jgi:vacuolar iron transporter family protein
MTVRGLLFGRRWRNRPLLQFSWFLCIINDLSCPTYPLLSFSLLSPFILGVCGTTGLVSTFLLVAGVTGANLSNEDILLTAIAGTIAGAISMSSGEYIATKTQEEVFAGEVGLERAHIARHREKELLELRECFEKIGIVSQNEAEQDEVDDLHQRLYDFYRPRDHAHLLAHVVLEFGILEDERRNPVVAATVAFCLFVCGALPSVIPYTFIANINVAFGTAGIFTLTGLFLVGAIKTWATRGNMWHAAIENLAVSAGGGAVAFAVGYAFERLVRGGDDDDDGLADGGGDKQLYPPM